LSRDRFQPRAELSWSEGRSLRLGLRWADGNLDRARVYARELVELQPDVIFADSTRNRQSAASACSCSRRWRRASSGSRPCPIPIRLPTSHRITRAFRRCRNRNGHNLAWARAERPLRHHAGCLYRDLSRSRDSRNDSRRATQGRVNLPNFLRCCHIHVQI
jgi:hypothetical protein